MYVCFMSLSSLSFLVTLKTNEPAPRRQSRRPVVRRLKAQAGIHGVSSGLDFRSVNEASLSEREARGL